MDEQQAILRCLAGDTGAYTVLVGQYQAKILALCLRMTGNREDAADVAQETFVQAYRHLDRYDRQQPFRPWLFRIATNQCIDFRRRNRRHVVAADETVLERASHPGAETETLVELAQDQEQVRRAVADLPDPYRTAVLLYYFQGLSYQEIAKQTALSVGTISTHLHRAKHLLKRRLSEEGVDPDGTYHARTTPALSSR